MGVMNTQSNHKPFYVYSYTDVRPGREGEVIYIGKGTYTKKDKLRRMESHWKADGLLNRLFFNVLQKIRLAGLEPVRQVIVWCDTEQEAFDAEVEKISFHRLRKHGGTLCNQTFGGEGPSGAVHGEEVRRRVGIATKNAIANQSDETKKKLSDFRRTMATERHNKKKMVRIQALDFGDLSNLCVPSKVIPPRIVKPKGTKSQASTSNWASSEFKARTSAAIKAAKTTPEARARTSAINSEIWASSFRF